MSSRPASLQPADRPRAPTLIRLASYATCEISRRIYRWSRSNWRIERRAKLLQERLGKFPRLGVGTVLSDLDPELDRRLGALRQPDCELVVADFDQNGLIASRFGDIAGIDTIDRKSFMTRSGCPVLLVDLNGRLGVRKEFRNRGRFVQELEAFLHLEESGCPVPQLMNVDWQAGSITTTFVPGGVVRELLAAAGADIRNRDDDGSYTREIDRQRIRIGREFVPQVLSSRHIENVAAGLDAIHAAGFVLEDVKFGNIILKNPTGEPIFVDLERALPVGSLPPMLANHLREIDLKKFREHFGDVPSR